MECIQDTHKNKQQNDTGDGSGAVELLRQSYADLTPRLRRRKPLRHPDAGVSPYSARTPSLRRPYAGVRESRP